MPLSGGALERGLSGLGRFAFERRRSLLAFAGLLLLAAILVVLHGGALGASTIEGLPSDRAQALVDQVTGRPSDTTFVAIFHSEQRLDPDDDAFQAAETAALAPLRRDGRVLAVETAAEAPAALSLGMENGEAHSALAFVSLRGDRDQAAAAYPAVRAELRSSTLQIVCTGRIPFLRDLDQALEHDLLRGELVSLPLALLILLWVFRSLVAALLPVAVGALSVLGGIAVVMLLSQKIQIAQYTINVCSLIGLGVAIDYSLFTVSRFREELAAGATTAEALPRTLATAGRVVLFSGLAVASGMGGLLVFRGSYLAALGLGGAIVVSLAVIFALTVLPALLAVLGPWVDAGRIGRPREPGGGGWRRVATAVMRRPLRLLLPTLAVLVVAALPFSRLRLGAADVTVLGRSVEARRGYELLRRSFPEEAETRIAVAVEFPSAPVLTRARVDALYALSRRIGRIPGVAKVESIVNGAPFDDPASYERLLLQPPPEAAQSIAEAERLTLGPRVALLFVLTEAPSQSDEARAIVRAIRAEPRVGDGRLEVAGQAASDVDASDYVLRRTPYAIGIVVLVTGVVLFLMLGSLVLPLKAILLNFLSIGASFGALVWIFQEGHLWIRHGRPIEPSLPVILFCVLFGLSMDYEVLMLSRIKEAYDETHDNVVAVADGLARTAGLITSAAAIMIAVFGAFALAGIAIIQAVGFGMGLAVAIDATLVRILLVPATMRLFGDLNWWAPAPIERLRRALGLGH